MKHKRDTSVLTKKMKKAIKRFVIRCGLKMLEIFLEN